MTDPKYKQRIDTTVDFIAMAVRVAGQRLTNAVAGIAATPATDTVAQPGITFATTSTGPGANAVTITFDGATPANDATPVTVVGSAITVQQKKASAVARTLTEIVALFAGGVVTTAAGGAIVATLTGTGSAASVAHALHAFSGGAAAVGGPTVKCECLVQGTRKTDVTWSVDAHGAIDATTGVFTPSTAGVATVTATDVFDGSKTATAQITVA